MRFRSKKIGLIVISTMFGLMAMGAAITSVLLEWDVTLKNVTAVTQTDKINAFDLVSSSLISGGEITSDALNSHVHGPAGDTHFMPASNKMQIHKAFKGVAGVFTDDTNNAQTASASPSMELPHATNEVYDIGLYHRSRILHLDISQGTEYVLDVDFEYCSASDPALAAADQCTTWTPFSSWTDSTVNFTQSAEKPITFILPSSRSGVLAWVPHTQHGTKAYWIRIVIASASGSGAEPYGAQLQSETAEWLFYTNTIGAGATYNYSLYTGGPAIGTYHYYFPDLDGIDTPYNANMEPGSEWNLDINQNFLIDGNITGKVFGKTAGLNLDFTSAASAGANNTLTLTAPPATASTFAGVWTHSEEDGTSYYSGTSEESYSKGFFNGASNYKTAREEDSADVVSNTDSSVTSTKIGQAYDKTTETTSAFGAKINDPS